MEDLEYPVEERLHLTRIINRGAVSLYLIALLSVVNISLLTITGMETPYFIAFGVTAAMKHFMTGNGLYTVLLILVALAFSLLFVILGIYGQRKHAWTFFAGFFTYTADCLLLILLQDWSSVILHFIIIYFILFGLNATRKYHHQNTSL